MVTPSDFILAVFNSQFIEKHPRALVAAVRIEVNSLTTEFRVLAGNDPTHSP